MVNSAHGAEIARASRRMQLEQIAARAAEEFAIDADALIAEYGPGVLDPAGRGGPAAAAATTARRRRSGPRPRSACWTSSARSTRWPWRSSRRCEERHAFLVTQLEDLKKTRRDLLTVIKEVDDRVQQVFAAGLRGHRPGVRAHLRHAVPRRRRQAGADRARRHARTGIEIEARPPGKKVKRLSLLSGGERALTAIAFLVAIFKARPSPFYVLDEVEAALDDSNLQRLLQIFDELRESSQLIIVTHQKRTMEVADSLYGISMRGDGVSTVISQRLRERESA